MHNAEKVIDRRAFITKLGGAAAVAAMAPEVLAEAVEHEMMHMLDLLPLVVWVYKLALSWRIS